VSELPSVTDATFAAEVLNAGRPVVVDFWAPWCGPCRAIAPIMQELAGVHGERVGFVKLNVDENPATASAYGVLSIPTVILFDGGEARETVVGARPRRHFEQAFGEWFGGTQRGPEGLSRAVS
jgi:thioredoxin 1